MLSLAAVAYPERPVYCIIGDCGLRMLLGELITVAAYKLNIKVIVIKNNTLVADQVGADGLSRQPGICLLSVSCGLRDDRARMRHRRG